MVKKLEEKEKYEAFYVIYSHLNATHSESAVSMKDSRKRLLIEND
jgi:hypothetical protein